MRAVAAVGGGLYTRSQAQTAKDALAEAKRSAIADLRSSYAALDSARSDREAVDLARATLDREDAPTFELTLEQAQDGSFGVTAKMLSGVPEILVDTTWITECSWPSGEHARTGRLFYGHGPDGVRLVRTESFGFRVRSDPQADRATVTVYLDCRDAADENRTWRYPQVLE